MPHRSPHRRPLLPAAAWLLAAATATATATAPARGERVHVHGLVTLEVAVEPGALSLRLEAPQDSLLGHERVPRTPAERAAATAALQRLADPARLVALPAALGCRAAPAQVDAPRLQPGAAPAAAAGGDHAEVSADWRFDCRSTAGLRSLDLGGLLDAFPRIQRVQAQVVTPGGQHQAGLQRPARALAWGR